MRVRTGLHSGQRVWTHRYHWGNNETRAALKGLRCRIVSQGAMGSVLLEFEDGSLVVSSRRSLRRLDSC